MFEQSFLAKSKCAGCVLRSHAKDYPCQKEMDNPWLVRKGNRVLVVLEQPRQYQRGASYLQNVLRAIENHLGEKVDAIAGIECETKIHAVEDLSTKKNLVEESPIPNPFYKIYRICNTVTPEIMQSYQVILTMGKALLAITKSDDIPSWEDFAEFNFNQTYFYTGVDTNPRRRVYPLPSDLDIYAKDNFEAKFFTPFQLQRVKEYLLAPEEPNLIELPRYEIVSDPVEFLRLLDKKLPKSEEVGVDIETNGLNPFAIDALIKCVTISFTEQVGYYLDWEKLSEDKTALSDFLKDRPQTYANGAFDYLWLWLNGIENLEVTDDAVLLFHLLNTERRRNSIKSLAWLVGLGGYDQPLEDLKDEYGNLDYSTIEESILAPYACTDPALTVALKKLGHRIFAANGNFSLKAYRTILSASPAFRQIEKDGVPVNMDYLNEITEGVLAREQQVAKEISEILKIPVESISSAEQLGIALKAHGLPNLGVTKKGNYSTGEAIVQKWSKQGHAVADKILLYRKLSKQRQAFLGKSGSVSQETGVLGEEYDDDSDVVSDAGLLSSIQPDGKLHPRYMEGMAKSSRTKHHSPNIAQFPARGEEGTRFKPVIGLPGNDWYIMNMDFSGIQLRIIAIKSGDKKMIQAFNEYGGDLHSMTARSLYTPDLSIEQFIKNLKDPLFKSYRYSGKIVNFFLSFGGKETTLAKDLESEWTQENLINYLMVNGLIVPPENIEQLEEKEKNITWQKSLLALGDPFLVSAKDIRGKFFNLYTGVAEWIERNKDLGIKHGFIDDIHFGYRRHLPFLYLGGRQMGANENTKRFFNLLNITTNTLAQSSESLHVYSSLARIHKELNRLKMRSRPFAVIHDYIGFYCHRSEIEELYYIARNNAEDHTSFSVPLEVEVTFGKIWEGDDSEKLNASNIKQIAKKLGG